MKFLELRKALAWLCITFLMASDINANSDMDLNLDGLVKDRLNFNF